MAVPRGNHEDTAQLVVKYMEGQFDVENCNVPSCNGNEATQLP